MKLSTLLVLVPVAAVAAILAVANREEVAFRIDPFAAGDAAAALVMPLFLLVFLSFLLGVLVGGATIALRRGRFKYLFTPARSPASPVPAPEDEPILPAIARHELYDEVADPGETQDLAASRADVLNELRAEVKTWLAEQHQRGEAVARRAGVSLDAPGALDPTVESQLRALGYVN